MIPCFFVYAAIIQPVRHHIGHRLAMAGQNHCLALFSKMQEFRQPVLGFLDGDVHGRKVATGSYFVKSLIPAIADHRQIADRQLAQFFRAMGGIGVEEKRVAGVHVVGLVAMAINYIAFDHIEKFQA